MGLITKGLKEIEDGYKHMARTLRIGETRAIKRVGTTIKAAQSRDIGATLNLRAATIKNELQIKKEPKVKDLRLVFQVKKRGVPLREFVGTRQIRRGVSVAVLKGKGRAILTAAFGVTKFGNHFYGRVGKNSAKQYGRPHVGRLPLKKLFGPSVADIYSKDDVLKTGADVWNERLPIELEREQLFALKKAGLI